MKTLIIIAVLVCASPAQAAKPREIHPSEVFAYKIGRYQVITPEEDARRLAAAKEAIPYAEKGRVKRQKQPVRVWVVGKGNKQTWRFTYKSKEEKRKRVAQLHSLVKFIEDGAELTDTRSQIRKPWSDRRFLPR